MGVRFKRFGTSTVRMLLVAFVGLAFAVPSTAIGLEYKEVASLQADVAGGKLPPVGERVPAEPAIATLDNPGRSGGEIRTLFGRTKDIRLMTVYGYARLVGYTSDFTLQPDIAKAIEVEDGRIFTIRLRAGHRWSDGHPFTAEDFRYFWEDMATDPTISPLGPDNIFVVEGKLPAFEVIDPQTVRYTWEKPNPYFLPALAAPRPPFIYRPAHYLKQFHAAHTPETKLKARVTKAKQRDWRALHFKRDRPYRCDNPDYPTLQPWRNTTKPPSERFIFKRNAFYHRVDQNGVQLPYIDQVTATISSGDLIPAKVGTGDADLQARSLAFKNYTFLKNGEKRNDYKVRLWRSGKGAHVALYPNLNVRDKTLRKVVRDVRFRRALSMGIDRTEINQVVFFGLALEGNNTVLPESPLYDDDFRQRWTEFDVDAANELLDEMGLTERTSDGVRKLANGEKLEIIVETPGEDQDQTDVLQLIRDSWKKIGISLFIKPSRREVMRERVKTGTTAMSVFFGLDNGLVSPESSPREFVPSNEDQLQWPLWGRHFATVGQAGEEPDMPEAERLVELFKTWTGTIDSDAREEVWNEILEINADQMFSIGVVAGVPQPVAVSNKLQNVPEEGVFNWDPGAQFGLYRPDTFWLSG